MRKRESKQKPVTEKYQRGRKPQTAEVRSARGRPPLKAKEKHAGMQVQPALPAPPESLDEQAREEWNRLGKYLLKMKRVSHLDLQSLAAYCTSYAIYGMAVRPLLINRQPLYGHIAGKPKPAAGASVALAHAQVVIDIAAKFGLTARTRYLNHADTGRPLVPDELHEMRGNPSKKHLHQTAAIERLGEWDIADVTPPYWFNADAKAEWDRIVHQLELLKIWTPLDVGVVAVNCGSFALLSKCMRSLKDEDVTLSCLDREGNRSDESVENPLSVIYRKHLGVCEAIWKEYGMSPLDRARFSQPVAQDDGKPKLRVYL